MNVKTIAAIIALSAIALTGCSSTPAAPAGKPEVHTRIKAMTDCAKLQKEFDLAEQNGERDRNNGKLDLTAADTAYMQTALDRQNELKCFG